MEKLGLCMVCGRPANMSCKLCGKLVCSIHLDRRTGLCPHCLATSGGGEGSQDKAPPGRVI